MRVGYVPGGAGVAVGTGVAVGAGVASASASALRVARGRAGAARAGSVRRLRLRRRRLSSAWLFFDLALVFFLGLQSLAFLHCCLAARSCTACAA